MNEHLRKQIYVLANGKSNDILDSMKEEIHFLEETFEKIPEYKKQNERECKNRLMESNMYYKKAEKAAMPLDSMIDRIHRIETKSGMKRYIEITNKLAEDNVNPEEYGKLHRELQFLKKEHTKDLSDLTSYKHQALLHRLKIIQCWKNMLSLEIDTFKKIKEFLSDLLIEQAQKANNPKILEYILEQLDQLEQDTFGFQITNIDTSELSTSQMKTLINNLKTQLNEVVQMGKVIHDKKTAFQSLTKIISSLQKDADQHQEASSAPELDAEQEVSEEQSEKKKPEEKKAESLSRMAHPTAKRKKSSYE